MRKQTFPLPNIAAPLIKSTLSIGLERVFSTISFCWNNLPSCPLTEDPDDVMFPFSYNPKCGDKFDKHVYN